MSIYQLRAKKMKLQLAVLLISVLLEGSVALPRVGECLTRFEKSLKEIKANKKYCMDANVQDCCQIAEASKIIDKDNCTPKSGIYSIRNPCSSTGALTQARITSKILCNMESSYGGWTVLMKRTPDVDEKVSFKRPWVDYENGFGNLSGEFWYGLKNMHCLTSRESMEVEVELRKTDGTKKVLSYGNFRVDGPDTSYTLHVSDKHYEGFDYFLTHNGMKFSTFDQDNDPYTTGSCSKRLHECGFWFNLCYNIYLTDMPKPVLYNDEVFDYTSYDYAELRVRPKSCPALGA